MMTCGAVRCALVCAVPPPRATATSRRVGDDCESTRPAVVLLTWQEGGGCVVLPVREAAVGGALHLPGALDTGGVFAIDPRGGDGIEIAKHF